MNFIYVDESRNLMHLIYVGTLDKTSAQHLLAVVKTAIGRLHPRFDILADLRDLKAVDKEAVKIIDELMDLLNACGVGMIVRVLSSASENFGFAIMSVFHYGHDVRFVTCFALEEAVAHLSSTRKNSLNKPSGIRQVVSGSPILPA